MFWLFLDKQNEERKDETRTNADEFEMNLTFLRYKIFIVLAGILIKNTKFPFTFCNCTFRFVNNFM